MRAARVLTLACLAMLLLAPAVARADDASVYRAYTEDRPQFKGLLEELERAGTAWERSKFRRTARFLRALSAIRKAAGVVYRDVRAQQASTRNGELARSYALRSVRTASASFSALAAAVRAIDQRRRRSALGHLRRGETLMDRSDRYDRLATKYFRAAGVVPPR